MSDVKTDAKAIFLEALDYNVADERMRFLEKACGSDAALRLRVEELLRAHRDAGAFLCGAEQQAATREEPISERPGTVIGPYKLLEQIGEGGFGVVFMAEQTEPVRRKVALKILKPGMDTRQVVARFEAERQALAIMDHPNIAKVFDGGSTDRNASGLACAVDRTASGLACAYQPTSEAACVTRSGRPYFVMELVKGTRITDFCDQNQLTPRQRLELFLSVCHAVQHAHNKGIIHRDLKPSNVLVSRHDTTPVVKVIDFGVAKALGQELTDKTFFTGVMQMIGTPLYMSPEQAGMSDLDIDTRSDIYTLGVLLYELLTGTTPFDKERFKHAGYEEIRRIIREEEPPRPSTRLSDLSRSRLPGGTLAGTSDDTASAPDPAVAGTGPAQQAGPTSLASISAQRQTEPAKLTKLMRGELDWIVMKALDKDRTRRYETANAFAADVQRYLADEPVEACPPSATYQMRKFVRKHGAGLTTTAAFTLLLLFGLFWYQQVQIDRAAENARQQALQDARREGVERDIALALDEAATIPAEVHRKLADPILFSELLSDLEGWKTTLDRARAAWKRADVLVGGNRDVVEAALQAQVQARGAALDADENDWRFAKELDDIRLESSTLIEGKIDARRAGPKYAKFFSASGLDFKEGQTAQLSEWIRGQRLRFVLVASLDHWARATKTSRLLAVARLADPDRWRDLVRDSKNLQNQAALEKLALEADFSRQSPHVLALLGAELGGRNGPRNEEIAAFVRKALIVHPRDFWLNFELAKSATDAGERIGCLRAALAVRPNSAAAYNNLGNALRDKKDLDGAIRNFEKAIALDPSYATAHNNLGLALFETKDMEGAIHHCQKAIAIDSTFALPHVNLGNALSDKKDLEGAIRHYEKAIVLDPKLAAAHSNLGIALREKKDLDGAIRHCQKAIELDPDFAMAHNALGNVLADKKDVQGAIQQYEKAISLDPNYANAHYNLGNALRDKKDLDGAIRHFEKAIALAPNHARAHVNLGNILRGKDLEGAIRHFEKAIEIDPNLPQARNSLRNALREKKNLVEVHYNLGNAHREKKDPEGAIRNYEKAIALDPNHAQAHYNLAGVLGHVKNDLEGAISHYKEAIRIAPNFAEAYCNLAQVLRDKGQFVEALSQLRRGHELGLKNPRWPYPSERWVKDFERLVQVDAKLAKVLMGEAKPANLGERLEMAEICQLYKSLYGVAVRFYADAFAEQPRVADDLKGKLRYNAACAAALAACGQGKDADQSDEKDRCRLRRQAVDWLRGDLVAWSQLLNKDQDKVGSVVAQTMRYWQNDADFASLRGETALAKLPDAEREEWRNIWSEVETLRQRAAKPSEP